MARYRTYKNGIFGHRHNGYYIIKGEKKGDFSIQDKNGNTIEKDIYDFDEATWIIDKITVSEYEMGIIKHLYTYEIYQLSSLFVELMNKENKDEKSLLLYKWCEVVRRRKAGGREF